MDDVLLDQIFVGSAASLANLAIYALLIGIVAWTVRNLSMRDTRIPAFLQILATYDSNPQAAG